MKLRSAAANRNAEPIAAVLRRWLPATGLVLEVASGSGEHALAFARAFPQLVWQPSDPDAAAVASIETWRVEEGAPNLQPPLRIDVTEPEWGISSAQALLAINLVHISPWEASLGLLKGAARLLPPGAPMILYGPWLVEGVPTAPSNLAFDESLKARDPRWGLRRVEDFAGAATARGLQLHEQCAMPANNRMLLFRRAD